jgi:hypothetical protein
MIDLKIEEADTSVELNLKDHVVDIMNVVNNNLDMEDFSSQIRSEVKDIIEYASISIDI